MRLHLLFAMPAAVAGLATHSDAAAKPAEMLTVIQKRLEQDAEKDSGASEKMACFCQTYLQQKESAVTQLQEELDGVSHDLEAQTAENARLHYELDDHRKELEEGKADLASATAIRERHAAQVSEDEKAHVENIGQLDGALTALGSAPGSDSGLALAQLRGGSRHSEVVRRAVAGLSTKKTSPDEIRGILKQMRANFHENLQDLRHEEATSAAQHDDLVHAKAAEIDALQHRVERKTQLAAAGGVDVARKHEQQDKSADLLQSNQRLVSAMQGACQQSEDSAQARKDLRQTQLVDLAAALADLSGTQLLAVTGGRRAHAGPEDLCLAGISLPTKELREAAHSACEQARSGRSQDAADAVQDIVDQLKTAQANATASAEQCSHELRASKDAAQEAAQVDQVHANVISSDKQTLEEQIKGVEDQAAGSEKAKTALAEAKQAMHGAVSDTAMTANSIADVTMHLQGRLPANVAGKLAAVKENSNKLKASALDFDTSLSKQVDSITSLLDASSRSAARLLIPLRLHRADVEEEEVDLHEKQHHSTALASRVHCDAAGLSGKAQQLGAQAEKLGTIAADLAYAALR